MSSLFLGNIEAKADSKGRIFIPSVFRKQLLIAEESYLVLRKDIFQDCLVLYPASVWEKEIELLRSKLNKWDKSHQQLFRQFLLDAERVELDGSGRILIPKRYFSLVNIQTEVRFLGMDNTIEIWAKEKLDEPLLSSELMAGEIERVMKSL